MSSSSPATKLRLPKDLRRPSESRFLVQNILPLRGLAVVWGEPKSGKTFWVLDIAFHIASGKQWRGLATKQGPVVYGCFEGRFGIADRVQALGRHLNGGDQAFPLYTYPERITFTRKKMKNARAPHEDFIAEIQNLEIQPVLVILDTLHRSIEGNENESMDMRWYTDCAMDIADSFGCLVLIVHHPGKEGYGPRGSASLSGTVDAQLKVGKKGAITQMVVEFAKDGPDGEAMAAELVVVDMDPDAEGIPVKTCVLRPITDGGAFPLPLAERRKQKESFIRPHLRKQLATLRPLVEEDGWASYDAWLDICTRDRQFFNSPDRDQRKRSFQRNLVQLKEARLVEQSHERVRITEEGMKLDAA